MVLETVVIFATMKKIGEAVPFKRMYEYVFSENAFLNFIVCRRFHASLRENDLRLKILSHSLAFSLCFYTRFSVLKNLKDGLA